MEKAQTSVSLSDIRKSIDETDHAILALLERRFAAVELVKALKTENGDQNALPIRPAREAVILRQLAKMKGKHVPLEFMVRLWRCIFTAATRIQAPVQVLVSRAVEENAQLREIVRDHFAGMPTAVKNNEDEVLRVIAQNKADIAVVATTGEWTGPFLGNACGGAKVIGSLPIFAKGGPPPLLMIGHVEAESTGDDETLVIATGELPKTKGLTPLWSSNRLVSLPGFISVTELAELVPVEASSVFIAGRYPRPFGDQT